MRDRGRRWRLLAAAGLLVLAPVLVAAQVPSTRPSVAVDPARRLDDVLGASEPGTRLGVWVGGPDGPAWYARDADVSRPVASAIKTAYLIELFTVHADELDAPLSGIDEFLSDSHPAVAHFTADQRDEIRRGLREATVRTIGHHMIRGTGVSNVVYNAAANVTTASLGGPARLTGRIHARDPAFGDLAVRRYMLAARDVTGDNEATPRGLAAVLQRVAARAIPGVAPTTVEAIRDVLRTDEADQPDAHYAKTGSLDSDPLIRIRSGFLETPAGIIVYVVMGERPGPGSLDRGEAGRRLEATVEATTDALVSAARDARGTPPSMP